MDAGDAAAPDAEPQVPVAALPQPAHDRPPSRAAAGVIVLVWIACAVALGVWLVPRFV